MNRFLSIGKRILTDIVMLFFAFLTIGMIISGFPIGIVVCLLTALWFSPLKSLLLRRIDIKKSISIVITSTLIILSLISLAVVSLNSKTNISVNSREVVIDNLEGTDNLIAAKSTEQIDETSESSTLNSAKELTSPVTITQDATTAEPIEELTPTPTDKPIVNVTPTEEVLDEVTNQMEVHYIDVGQGDSTLIKCGDEAMLIDAGDENHGSAVRLYLKKQGVTSLKYLILTHSDADHIGGAASVITNVPIDTVFMCQYEKDNLIYENLINALFYKNLSWSTPDVGSEFTLGNARYTVVAPNNIYPDPNNSSIAIILHHGTKSFLFTGDAEVEAENDILQNGISIACDVYQAGHHGSYTASTAELLDAAKPKYTVISCAMGNSYGHPHEDALTRIKGSGSELFRIDEQGTIIAYSDGTNLSFNVEPINDWTCGEAEVKKSASTLVKEAQANENATSETQVSADEPQAAPASDITYVCNKNTMKFHYPDCDSVNEMKPKNRMDVTLTREEVIAQGYIPCKRCNP